MDSTLFSTVSRIAPAHISNVYQTATKDVPGGFLVKGTTTGVKSYDDLDAIEQDYEAYTPVWKKARAFFAATQEAAAFFVLTFAPGTVEAPVTQAPTTPASSSASSSSSSDSAASATPASTPTVTTPTTKTSALSADATGAVAALKKYYFAGPAWWALVEFDDEIAHAVSNFVELQNTGVFVLFSTDATKLQTYADNKRTMLLTLPAVDDSAADVQDQYNNVMDAAFIGRMYGRSPHAPVKYAVGDLPYTKSQDQYDFTPDDAAELDKYNIVTYAYVLTTPLIISSRMAANDIHIDHILGWDWIQNQINTRVANFFVKNNIDGVPYDQNGFDSVVNVIKSAFIDAFDMKIIASSIDENGNETGQPDYSVTYKNPGQLPKSYETKRQMRGVKTQYRPLGMAEDVYIENTIEM